MKFLASLRNIPYLRTFVVAIILTISAGWILTSFLTGVAKKNLKDEINREANVIAFYLQDNLGDVENAAMALSHSEQLEEFLSTGSPVDLEKANKLLDRVNSTLGMSVCYLLDKNGLVVVSSNRNEKDSFVGKNYAYRPYFTGALSGRLATYFAVGTTSNERGYYAAMPVVSTSGSIAGVIVAKRNIAPVGEFLRKYTNAFLISPEGIIFISSKERFLFNSLWPIAEKSRAILFASKQFGDLAFKPLLDAEPQTGDLVSFNNEEHYLQRLPIGKDGWTLVVTKRPAIIGDYRLFSILISTTFALLLLFFFNTLLNKNKSLELARELLKSRHDWELTFDMVPDLIAIIDANHRITSMNRAMAERLGISTQEAVGRRCYELLHGSQEPFSFCPHQRMLVSGATGSESLFIKALDGDFVISVTPITSKDGSIESSIHVMHDVSELKQLERSQQEYAQRLEYVLEGSNDATWEWDIVTNQGVLNKRYYEMIECTPGEVDVTLEFFLTTIHPDDVDDVQRRVQDNVEGKTNEYEAHYRMVTKSGKVKNVMGRGKIVKYDEEGRPIKMAGVITDTTEMKRLNDEVNRISNLESIGLLSGGLAHDFNNVLNVIYGNISFVKMLADGNAAIVEPLIDAAEACERAKELGTRLQAFSQEGLLLRKPLALAALINGTAEALFKDSNISHSISAADDIHQLEADPRQSRQLFENLLSNAKDAMPEGGTVTIEINNCEVDGNKGLSLRSGPYVCITIQDDGSGIPEANLSKVFDPYFSTKDTYSQRGMGLGLSICHAIMKRHNGQISIESTLGIGTRVMLYLPAS